jgi:hypothetical protein
MSISVQSILSKLIKWNRLAEASKPVDPFACLTPNERAFYDNWWSKFRNRHSDDANGDALYKAWLSFTGWTPADILPNYPNTDLSDLSLDKIQEKYRDIRDSGKKR